MRLEPLGADDSWDRVEACGQSFLLEVQCFIQSPGKASLMELASSSHSLLTWIPDTSSSSRPDDLLLRTDLRRPTQPSLQIGFLEI